MPTTEVIDMSGCGCCSSSSSGGCIADQNCCPNHLPCTLYAHVGGCFNVDIVLEWNGFGWYGTGSGGGASISGHVSCSGGSWSVLPWNGTCPGNSFELYPCGPSPCTDPGPSVTCDPFEITYTTGYSNVGLSNPNPACCDQATGIPVTITA